MIDYYAHLAVLGQLRKDLAALPASDAEVAAKRDKVLADAVASEDSALVGSFVDHIFHHASSDGSELSLLEQTADVWKRGLALYDEVTAARAAIEQAILKPGDPESLPEFNNAVKRVFGWEQLANEILVDAAAIQAAIAPMTHVRTHPRQSDQRIENWDWGNIFNARRSDAFVRAVFEQATDDSTTAFALGVLGSYSGNVTGSAYLGHTVGGPRRLHPYRDRLARNVVGYWFRQHLPMPKSADLASRLRFGPPALTARLPAAIAKLLREAVALAYDSAQAPALPDLDLGLQRTIRHLELLDVFQRPGLPSVPTGDLSVKMMGLPPGGTGLHPTDTTPPGSSDGSGGSKGSGSSPTGADSMSTEEKGCLAFIIFVILVVVATVIDCIVQLVDHGKCDDPWRVPRTVTGIGDAPESSSAAALTAFAGSDAALHMVKHLYDMQNELWKAFDGAFNYLAKRGLVYPDDLLMTQPLYSNLVSIPNIGAWPHRAEVDPIENVGFYPSSPIENPSRTPSPFPFGASPGEFLTGSAGQQHLTASEVAIRLFSQIARKTTDSTNYDLDADRGMLHPCWAVNPGSSVNDDPIDVLVLAYPEFRP